MFEKYAPDAPANRVRITRNFVLSHPAHWIATFFGVGALRPAPGTWGTLAGVLVYGPVSYTHLTLPTKHAV